MKLIWKKLVATLFGISAIGGVTAVTSFSLTNCGNEQSIESIIKDTDVGGPFGGDTPSDELIWEWIVNYNPNINSTNLDLAQVIITNKTENGCDVIAKPHSGFVGTVHVTYNTTEPTWTLWVNGGTHYDTMINLTSRYVGKATIFTQTAGDFTHHYSFLFVQDDGTPIETPNMGGPDTGYHYDNLQVFTHRGNWSIDDKCIRFYGSGKYPGLNKIKFDVCRDADSAVVITMELDLTYQI